MLGLVAFLPRLYVAIAWTREPVWDGHYYDFGARRIAAGLGYSDGAGGWHPWCHWPVGYSGIVAATYKVFGHGPHVATIFNAVTGALLAVFTHRLARYELSANRARAAGLLCALYPGLIIYSALRDDRAIVRARARHRGMVLGSLSPRSSAARRGALRARDRARHARSPELLVFAPAPLFSRATPSPTRFAPPRSKRGIALAAISTAFAFLPGPSVDDSQLPRDGPLHVGLDQRRMEPRHRKLPRATGRFETLRSSDGCAVVTGQVAAGRLLARPRAQHIRSDPGRWLGLVPKKLGYTFDHESFPVEYLHEADPDRWPEDRRSAGRAWLTAAHCLLLTLAVFAATPFSLSREGRVARTIFASILGALTLFAWTQDPSPFYVLAVGIAALGWLPTRWSPSSGPCPPVGAPFFARNAGYPCSFLWRGPLSHRGHSPALPARRGGVPSTCRRHLQCPTPAGCPLGHRP